MNFSKLFSNISCIISYLFINTEYKSAYNFEKKRFVDAISNIILLTRNIFSSEISSSINLSNILTILSFISL